MGFFNWAAPMFHRADRRWTDEDAEIIAAWLRPFVKPGGTILDVGGGTGGLTIRLAHVLDAHATVLDATPEMLRYIPRGPGIEVVLGRAEAMPLPAASFDGLIVNDAFHHFRDQPRALREFSRVLRPGGGVLVLELEPVGLGMRLAAVVEMVLGEPAAFLTPDAMVEMMAAHGIVGTCSQDRAPSYHFRGVTGQPAAD